MSTEIASPYSKNDMKQSWGVWFDTGIICFKLALFLLLSTNVYYDKSKVLPIMTGFTPNISLFGTLDLQRV